MSTLENLGASISEGAKVVANKTRKVSGIASLKAQKSGAKTELSKLYKALGEAYYNDHADETVAYADIKDDIADVLKKIDKIDRKLADARGNVKCDACGEYVDNSSSFCPKCGAKIVALVEEEAEECEDGQESLKDKLGAAGNKVKEAVKDAEIKEKLGAAGNKVKEAVKDAELKDKFEAAGNKVKEVVNDPELKNKLNQAGDKAKEVAKEVGGKVSDVIGDAKEYFNNKKNPEDIVNVDDVKDEPSVEAPAEEVKAETTEETVFESEE